MVVESLFFSKIGRKIKSKKGRIKSTSILKSTKTVKTIQVETKHDVYVHVKVKNEGKKEKRDIEFPHLLDVVANLEILQGSILPQKRLYLTMTG